MDDFRKIKLKNITSSNVQKGASTISSSDNSQIHQRHQKHHQSECVDYENQIEYCHPDTFSTSLNYNSDYQSNLTPSSSSLPNLKYTSNQQIDLNSNNQTFSNSASSLTSDFTLNNYYINQTQFVSPSFATTSRSSTTGNYQSDSSYQQTNQQNTNKRPKSTFPFGKCKVCNDKATGVHYGVATCEGCKGFFKRSCLRKEKYRCFFGSQCPLTPDNRNRCKACRFRKCLEVGMSIQGVKMGRIPKAEKERALMSLEKTNSEEKINDLDADDNMSNMNSFMNENNDDELSNDSFIDYDKKKASSSTQSLNNLKFTDDENINEDSYKTKTKHNYSSSYEYENFELTKQKQQKITDYQDTIGNSVIYTNKQSPDKDGTSLFKEPIYIPSNQTLINKTKKDLEPNTKSSFELSNQLFNSLNISNKNNDDSNLNNKNEKQIETIQINDSSDQDKQLISKNGNNVSEKIVLFIKNSQLESDQSNPSNKKTDNFNFKLFDFVQSRIPFKTSNIVAQRVHSKPNDNQSINNYLEDKNLILSSLLSSKMYQLYLEHNERVDKLYKRAMHLVNKGINVFDGSEATIKEVWNGLVGSIPTCVKSLIEFCREIPGICDLSQKDLTILVNNRLFDYFIVRNSILFINNQSYLVLSNGIQYTREWMLEIVGEEMVESMFEFTTEYNDLNLTAREIALIHPYVLSTPDDSVKDIDALTQINEYFYNALMYEFDLNRRSASFLKRWENIMKKLSVLNELHITRIRSLIPNC